MLPEYLKDKSPQKKGRKQEDKARKHINSGAVWFDLFDVNDKNYLVDVKKVKKSHQIELQKIKELFCESVDQGKIPALLIYIGDFVIKATIDRDPDKK